jgi:hypothetical protein
MRKKGGLESERISRYSLGMSRLKHGKMEAGPEHEVKCMYKALTTEDLG